jgi:hypothetical protein
MEVHKKNIICGTNNRKLFSEIDKEVSCKKCQRFIKEKRKKKLYKVSWFNDYDKMFEEKIIEASTSSKAMYSCFKKFKYDGDYCENIGIQFQWFRNSKPKVKVLNKDSNILKPSLSFEEEDMLKKEEIKRLANEFDEKCPIGTKVLFQGDGKDFPIITTTRSKAQIYDSYLTIFLDNVSGSYLLDDRFVRVLTEENKDLKSLR